MRNKVDISLFKRDSSFYGEIPLLLTIKNFDLASIRSRYIKSRDNVSGRSGSVERREVGIGGLATLTLKNSEVLKCEVLAQLKEPRGIDVKNGKLAFSSESIVYVISEDAVNVIEDEWFSYIHTVNFSPWNAQNILVSSSGFDCIIEFDMGDSSKVFEWFAWEHGFSEGIDSDSGKPFKLTRLKEEADRFKEAGKKHLFIESPRGFKLPTAHRAAFINSVFYDDNDENKILATFFHEGALFSIDRNSGVATSIVRNLSKPHGGRNYKNGYLVTSTGDGEVVLGTSQDLKTYSVRALESKPEGLGDMEWVQNTVSVGELLVVIDSNRTAFIVVDPVNELYDMIPYDNNWAVQDAVGGSVSEIKKGLIKSIGLTDPTN